MCFWDFTTYPSIGLVLLMEEVIGNEGSNQQSFIPLGFLAINVGPLVVHFSCNPFIGALRIQEPVILHEPLIKG